MNWVMREVDTRCSGLAFSSGVVVAIDGAVPNKINRIVTNSDLLYIGLPDFCQLNSIFHPLSVENTSVPIMAFH